MGNRTFLSILLLGILVFTTNGYCGKPWEKRRNRISKRFRNRVKTTVEDKLAEAKEKLNIAKEAIDSLNDEIGDVKTLIQSYDDNDKEVKRKAVRKRIRDLQRLLAEKLREASENTKEEEEDLDEEDEEKLPDEDTVDEELGRGAKRRLEALTELMSNYEEAKDLAKEMNDDLVQWKNFTEEELADLPKVKASYQSSPYGQTSVYKVSIDRALKKFEKQLLRIGEFDEELADLAPGMNTYMENSQDPQSSEFFKFRRRSKSYVYRVNILDKSLYNPIIDVLVEAELIEDNRE